MLDTKFQLNIQCGSIENVDFIGLSMFRIAGFFILYQAEVHYSEALSGYAPYSSPSPNKKIGKSYVLFPDYQLTMFYISTKFCENICNWLKYREDQLP